MKILLIGKNGQLGVELENIFVETKTKLFTFGHKELDICNYAAVQKIIKKIQPDIVINASAQNVLIDCEKDPQKAFATNTFALKNLAELCHDRHCKLITYSTDYVFDGVKGKPYKETDRPNPLQMYGLSKLAGEITCLNYNPDSIVIRTSGLYAGVTGSRAKKGNIVLKLIKECKSKPRVEVSSEQYASPTYARDLAENTVLLLRHTTARGIYHLANEGYCSWYEFAKELVTLTNIPTRVIPVDRHGAYAGIRRPLYSALKNTRAKALGIVLPPWQDALKRYLAIVFP